MIVDFECSSQLLMCLHVNDVWVACADNQSLDFIFMIHNGSTGIIHTRLHIVCNVIRVELFSEKTVI